MLRIFTPVKIQRLRPGLNPQTWVPEASVLTTRPPEPSIAVVHTVLYFGIWLLVVGRYTSTFRRYLLCSSSDREVGAEFSSETFVALNQNAMRHISGGTDIVELHILKF